LNKVPSVLQKLAGQFPESRRMDVAHCHRPGYWNLPRLVTDGLPIKLIVLNFTLSEVHMKYGIAWLIGVPGSIILIWFLLNHL